MELIGRVLLRHVHKGVVQGVLVEVAVDAEPPLRIAVVARHAWPDVQPGDTIWVRGVLRLESLVRQPRNTHFVEALHPVAVLRRYHRDTPQEPAPGGTHRPGPGEEERDAVQRAGRATVSGA